MRASASSQQSTPPVCCPCAQAYSDNRFRYNTRYATRYAVKRITNPGLISVVFCCVSFARSQSQSPTDSHLFATIDSGMLEGAHFGTAAERSHVSRHSLRRAAYRGPTVEGPTARRKMVGRA